MSRGPEKSFVLFPLGKKRFALPAETVTELAQPDRLQTFPHCTPLLTGVLVRRGRIVPVCDIAQTLVGRDAPPRRFYLIAGRQCGARNEWTAIPVSGECELASARPAPPEKQMPDYVSAVLAFGDEMVEVVSLEKLMAGEMRA